MSKVKDPLEHFYNIINRDFVDKLTQFFEEKYKNGVFETTSYGEINTDGKITATFKDWRPCEYSGYLDDKYRGERVAPMANGSYMVLIHTVKTVNPDSGLDEQGKFVDGIRIHPKDVKLSIKIFNNDTNNVIAVLKDDDARKYIKDNWKS